MNRGFGGEPVSESVSFVDLKKALEARCYPNKKPAASKDGQSGAPEDNPDRKAVLEAHPDFLAVSWQGDLDYWRGVEFRREIARLEKLTGDKAVPQRRREPLALEAVRKRYAHKQNGPYAIERMVFYKASEQLPKSLERLAAECIANFHDARLHHYVILERCQPAADDYAELIFTRWRMQIPQHRECKDVVTALAAEINAEPASAKDGPGRPKPFPLWVLLLLSLITGLIAGAALILFALPEDVVTGLLVRLR